MKKKVLSNRKGRDDFQSFSASSILSKSGTEYYSKIQFLLTSAEVLEVYITAKSGTIQMVDRWRLSGPRRLRRLHYVRYITIDNDKRVPLW